MKVKFYLRNRTYPSICINVAGNQWILGARKYPGFTDKSSATLTQLADYYGTDKGHVYHGFTEFYDRYLSSIRHKATNVLEIGILKGNSLRMWRDYFAEAKVQGIDVNKKSLFTEERITTHLCSQVDEKQLNWLFVGQQFDVIIDDGSHLCSHQIKTFELLYQKIKPGGFYIVEDLHTSFLPNFSYGMNAYDWFKNINRMQYGINEIEFFHSNDRKSITAIISFSGKTEPNGAWAANTNTG